MTALSRRRLLRAGGASMLVGLGACTGSRPGLTEASAPAAPGGESLRSSHGPFIDAAAAGVPTDGTSDVTAQLQKVLADAAGGALHIPNGKYRVNADPDTGGSLRPASDTTITLADGAVIEVIPNGVDFSHLFRVESVQRVSISGGTLVGDREEHTSTTGEQGHLIAVFDSKDVRISNMTLTGAWGDGILIGYTDTPNTESRRVFVDHVRSIGNRRLGLSVIGAFDVEIAYSTFAANGGTAPGAGIDVEPEPGFEARNIVILGCRFTQNEGDGLLLGGLPSDGAISDVTIAGCVSDHNGIDGVRCFAAQRVLIEGLVSRTNSAAGLSMNQISGATVSSLISTENGTEGLLADPGVTNLDLIGATITRNEGDGISLRAGSSNVRIGSGLVAQNGGIGVALSGTDDVSIDSVTIDSNGGGELVLDSCENTVVHGCAIVADSAASESAIVSYASNGTQLVANRLHGSGDPIVSITGDGGQSAVVAANTIWGTSGRYLDGGEADVRENLIIQ